MNISKVITLSVVAVAAVFSACTVSRTPAPPLQGPSELALSLVLTASPDTLSMDGASQSLITVQARDENGQPLPNLQLRAEIVANGTLVDFGSLSARTLVTGSNGRATVVYTAPSGVQGNIPTLSIRITPAGNDASNIIPRLVDIRLVPPGIIIGSGPTPAFTFSPAAPQAFTDTTFDGSTSTAGIGASIVGYSWRFGDGGTATGVTATHRFSAGLTFPVTLTVTDSNGLSASLTKDVAVGGGSAPTANFAFSPAAPNVNQQVNFNGSQSTAGAGHQLVRWDWDFGSGTPQSGVTVSKTYDTAGTYNVILTVTDESGQTARVSRAVSISPPPGPSADFTFSPVPAQSAPSSVNFSSTSTTTSGAAITSYTWIWGDGSGNCPANCGTGVAPFSSVNHIFPVVNPPGTVTTYNVTLIVRDANGASSTKTIAVPVTTQ